MVTVESVLWMTFLLGLSIMVGEKVVDPLVVNAHQQAQLNEQSVQLIHDAMAACPAPTAASY